MPTAVVWVVNALAVSGAISVATAVAIGTFAATYGAALLLIGGLAYSSSKARQAKEDARNAYNAAQVDRLVNVSSTVAPRELVMGRVRKGGAVFYKATTGAYQQDMYLAIALAGHEIDAVEQIYLNDELVTLDAFGNVTTAPYGISRKVTGYQSVASGTTVILPPEYVAGSLTAVRPGLTSEEGDVPVAASLISNFGQLTLTAASEGRIIGYQYYVQESAVQITKHLGAPGQVADPSLRAAFPADWSALNTVQGVAYLVVRLRYSETAFPNGAPNVTAVIRGAKLYDPRSGVTAWTENPALMLRHVYQHPKFGKATITAAEDARIAVAANACDTSTSFSGAAAVALYRASLVLPFGTATRSGFDDLAQSMGGSWAFAGGELYCKAGVYTAPVMSLGDADLAVIQRDGAAETQRPIAINVHKERAQKFNTVKVKMWDSGQDYKEVSLTPLTGAALLARDGAELVQEVTFPAIGHAPQALHVAGVMMRDARDALAIELPFNLRSYPLELFDNVSLTLSRYGWVNKTFSILGRNWNAEGTLQLSLKETSASITQVDATFPAQGFAPNTNLPKPWIVADVGALTITSGTSELVVQQDGTVQSRMRVGWTQIVDAAVLQTGQIEVQYRLASSDGAWASLLVPGDETQVVTSNVTDGAIYIIRARAKTKLAIGDWNVQQQHQVIGKTEPPSNVSGLTIDGTRLSWQAVSDIDLAGYAIRYQYGSNTEWGTANAMHTGLITDMPYLLKSVPPGVVTIMLKAVDTTGNESLSPAYVVLDLGDSLVANVVESFNFRAAGWAGSVTNATTVSGNLQATQSDPAYRADASDFYKTDSGLFYSSNFDGLVWESLGFTPTLAAEGSNMTLAWTLTGTAPSVQYRQTGAELFYSPDTDVFYSTDALRFFDEVPPWQSWPGSVVADSQEYQFRVATSTGPLSGLLSAFVVSVDVPDKVVKLNGVAISPGGTRLSAIAGQFNAIENVQLTLQGGSTALSLEITDKSTALGPLITARNAAGTSVSATIDSLIQGY